MDSTTWFYMGVMIVVVAYAVFSIYLKKPLGLYIAAAFHIILGILSLPSIGLYVFGVAIIEILVGVLMTTKKSSDH